MSWVRTIRSAVVAVGVATLMLIAVASPAGAAGTVYATWSLTGANPSWSGTMDVAANGFPPATYTSDSNTPQLPSGTSTFLGPATPFGAVFGSSEGNPYINLRNAEGSLPSTTTFTFANPTPASGWGFALGDIDADMVTIQANGPDGPLTPDALSFQGTFNYCAASPVPPSCDTPPFTDQPVWNPITGTLTGNIADSQGAAGWFRPTDAITSLTFIFDDLSGIPIYQLWFAGLTSDISGAVMLDAPGGPLSPPPGTTLELRTDTGQPVLDSGGNPITAVPAADGSYSFPGVVAANYTVVVVPPGGYEVVGSSTLPADARAGDVAGVDFVLQQVPAPPSTTTPLPPTFAPTPTAGGGSAAPAGRGRIPATGASSARLSLAAAGLMAIGTLLVLLARRLRAL